MKKNSLLALLIPVIFAYCGSGFERFVPPSNSISGRGPKRAPKVLATTPADGATVSPVTTGAGTQIKVVFDMSMKQTQAAFINTYVRDIGTNNENIWYSVANSGATFTWSSTNVGDDTVTIQLGWVRWPENNIIGFDFKNSELKSLDDLDLDHSTKISFTVGFDPGRYKVVQTNQDACYFYSAGFGNRWEEALGCATGTNGEVIGSYNYPAGQNGFIDPKNTTYGITFFGSAGGSINGRRFVRNGNPQNIVIGSATQCNGTTSSTNSCNPYSVDPTTTLIWKTCSQGQNYADSSVVGSGDKCVNSGTDFTWGDAVNSCASMNTANGGQGYGGRQDWRLPTAQELENLVDYGIKNSTGATLPEPAAGYPEGPAIDGYLETTYPFNWSGAFPNTPITTGFWTATGISANFQGSIQYANSLVVEFKKGTVGSGNSGSMLDSRRATVNRKKVRCVAGPTVLPTAPVYSVSTVQTSGSGTQVPLTTTWGTFVGNDSNATFNVISAVASYDVQANQYYVTATFNKNVDATSGGTPANYCFATAAGTCPASVIAFTTVAVSGATVRIATAAQTASTAYKLIITGPVTSDAASGSVALTVNRALFTAYPASTFDVASPISPNTSTVQVTFNKLPTVSEASNTGNYCITVSTAVACGASAPAIASVSLSGYTATITTASALTPGSGYAIFASNIRYLGAQLVTDNTNKLQWRRCRFGVFDNSTCGDDGVATNDSMQWNDGLNSCNELNRQQYGVLIGTGLVGDRFRWRAPTLNELKSIADRSLFPTLGYAIDLATFPTPNVLTEDYGSSTNRAFNGDPNYAGAEGAPAFNLFWSLNYIVGFPSVAQKDNSTIIAGLKPPKKNFRCVRSIP